MLNSSDLKLGWGNNIKIYRTFFCLNPAFRIYILNVHRTTVDHKSLSDWPGSEFNSILVWTVSSLCSSKPASTVTIVEISLFTVLAFSFDGHLALLVCIKNLKSRGPDILDPNSYSAMGMFVRVGKTLVLNNADCWKMSVRKLQTKWNCNRIRQNFNKVSILTWAFNPISVVSLPLCYLPHIINM